MNIAGIQMPNRIIKESIWTSRSLANLSPRAELHFYRLLPVPDDYGCFESTASVIRGRCYPLNESIRSRDVEQWQDELDQNDLIVRWQTHNREYAIFPTWQRHQYVRQAPHQRKTPEPPQAVIDRVNKILTDSDGDLPQVSESVGYYPNPNLNPNHKQNLKEKENIKEKVEVKPQVYLTAEETEKLIDQFGEDGANQRINALSDGKLAKGYKYKSDYHAILNWARNEKGTVKGNGHKPGRDPDKFISGKYGHVVLRGLNDTSLD